jgi:hypothetical protein
MIPRVEPEGMLFGKPASTFPDHALGRHPISKVVPAGMRLRDFASPKNARNNGAHQLLCFRTAAHDTRTSHHSGSRDSGRSGRPQPSRGPQSDPRRSRAHRTVGGRLGMFSRGSSAIPTRQRLSVAAAQPGRTFDVMETNSVRAIIQNGTRSRAHRVCVHVNDAHALHVKTRRFRGYISAAAAGFLQPENRSFESARIRHFF